MNARSDPQVVLAYPHSPSTPEELSGAALLYFERPIVLTLPPQAIIEPSQWFFGELNSVTASWRTAFDRIVFQWRAHQDAFRRLWTLLSPLDGSAFKVIWLVYPANNAALRDAQNLIDASSLDAATIDSIVDEVHGASELLRHIAVEKAAEAFQTRDRGPLFEYCEAVFSSADTIRTLLRQAYFLRLLHVETFQKSGAGFLLTNSRLTRFFDALPISVAVPGASDDLTDPLAWEVFRQILSHYLDPLTPESVHRILRIRSTKTELLGRFRAKCQQHARGLPAIKSYDELPSTVAKFVEDNLRDEIMELLEIDRSALKKLAVDLGGSEKTWIGAGLILRGLTEGGTILTTAGAITAIGTFGAKAFKAAAERRQKLTTSAYQLVYLLEKRKL
jgi:hypothetical protein